MQVQPIQSYNNYQNPGFNAKFRYSGPFRQLWLNADKTRLTSTVDRFLEFDNYTYEVLNAQRPNIEVLDCFNKYGYVINNSFRGDTLPHLMELIMERNPSYTVHNYSYMHKENSTTPVKTVRPCETIKAKYFYNDPSGYFTELFNNSNMTEKSVKEALLNMDKTGGEINLEIFYKRRIYDEPFFDQKTGRMLGKMDCVAYELFNHATALSTRIYIPVNIEDKLAYLLKELGDGSFSHEYELTKNDSTYIFNRLVEK